MTDSSKIAIDLHLMLSNYKRKDVDILLEGVTEIFPVFSIFLCSVWTKLDKGEVYKSLFSNYESNANQLSENMYLRAEVTLYPCRPHLFSDLFDIR